MSTEAKRQAGQQFKLRIPDDLYQWAKETAHADERPLAYVIIKALKQFKERHDHANHHNG